MKYKFFMTTISSLIFLLLLVLVLAISTRPPDTITFSVERLLITSDNTTVEVSNLTTTISVQMLDKLLKASESDTSSEANRKLDIILDMLGAPTK